MSKLLGAPEERFQPEIRPGKTGDDYYHIRQRLMAALVGLISLGLPFILLIGSALGACYYDSISHYYYARFWGGVFSASLVFIGAFLIAYSGENKWENRLATLAGLCALSNALFPASHSGCDSQQTFDGRAFLEFEQTGTPGEALGILPAAPADLFVLIPPSDMVHNVTAVIFFLFLAYYSAFVFTRIIPDEHLDEHGNLKPVKRRRNFFYRAAACVIVAVIVSMGVKTLIEQINGHEVSWWDPNNMTFIVEAIALWAFGLSWVIKGRFFGLALLDDREKR